MIIAKTSIKTTLADWQRLPASMRATIGNLPFLLSQPGKGEPVAHPIIFIQKGFF